MSLNPGESEVDPARYKRILGISLPIMGGMVSQNLLNLVDTAMVGRLGTAEIAAVGLGGFANFLAISLILGLSAGVQAMAARRLGEGRTTECAAPLHGGLLTALGAGIPLSIGLYFLTPYAFPLLSDDPAVIAAGVPYLQTRLIVASLVGVNFSYRGFWNGVQKSSVYMSTLVIMHVVNICLNYVLIFGKFGAPALGATGAGMASAISVAAGSLFYTVMGLSQARSFGYLQAWPSRKLFGDLLRLSLPNGVQQLFFSGGLTLLFAMIAQVGTEDVAAANIVTNIMLTAFLPGMGIGLGAASLVGQALGKGDPQDARRWGRQSLYVGIVVMGLIGAPMVLIPETLLGVFTHEREVIVLGAIPLRMTGAIMAIEAVNFVLMNALLGAGDSRRVMLLSVFFQWGLYLPAVYVIGPLLGYGLLAIWSANIVYRLLLAASFLLAWRGDKWQRITV